MDLLNSLLSDGKFITAMAICFLVGSLIKTSIPDSMLKNIFKSIYSDGVTVEDLKKLKNLAIATLVSFIGCFLYMALAGVFDIAHGCSGFIAGAITVGLYDVIKNPIDIFSYISKLKKQSKPTA